MHSIVKFKGCAPARVCVGLLVLAVAAPHAHAQVASTDHPKLKVSAPAPVPVRDNSIVITAHRAKSDADSDSPLTTLTAVQMALTGTATIEQVLQTVPAMGFQGVNASSATGFGVYFVDLRSLNFNRTLTVVDGHRFVVSGIKTDEAVDLNNVPVALIEQIDILRAGSEPFYGADAVAGVVNVKIKKNFNGILMNLYAGLATPGGDGTGEINATVGHNFDRGNITVNVGYFRRDPIRQSSRGFAANPVTDATILPNGSFQTTIGIPATIGGHAISGDGSIDDVFIGSGQKRPFDAATDSYNFGRVQDLQGSLKRETANILAHYDIVPGVEASAQILFSDRQSDFLQAPQVLGLAGTEKNPEGFVIQPGLGGNPYTVPVELQRVMEEVGPQNVHADGYTYRALAGLRGKIGKFDWNLSYDHGESKTTYKIFNSVNLTRALELASCEPGSGCMSANFFGPASLSAADADYIRYTDVSRSKYTEDVAEFSLGTKLAKLQGGPLAMELGVELRREAGYTHMDPVSLAGDQAGADTADTSGSYHSAEAYIDVNWPLLANLPWAHTLTFDTAVRYTHFNLFGGYPTWKVSGSYAPDANIRFRATIGLARRQPAITEAFAGLSSTLTTFQDPCDSVSGSRANPVVAANCAAQGLNSNFTQSSPLLNIASGGNPHLKPESSHNLTFGTVLTPKFLKGLSIAADYYQYHIIDAINSLADTNSNFIPETCYESQSLSSPLCALVERTSSGPNAGQINRILALDANVDAIMTDGLDFDVNYRHALSKWASITISWQTNYLLNYSIRSSGETSQYAGHFASLTNTGSYAHVKSLLATTIRAGNWTLGWRVHYIGGATVLDQDPKTTPYTSAPAVWYHDLVASYQHKGVIYTLGVDNVGDRKPPTLLDGLSNTNLNTYDIDGPFIYLRISSSF